MQRGLRSKVSKSEAKDGASQHIYRKERVFTGRRISFNQFIQKSRFCASRDAKREGGEIYLETPSQMKRYFYEFNNKPKRMFFENLITDLTNSPRIDQEWANQFISKQQFKNLYGKSNHINSSIRSLSNNILSQIPQNNTNMGHTINSQQSRGNNVGTDSVGVTPQKRSEDQRSGSPASRDPSAKRRGQRDPRSGSPWDKFSESKGETQGYKNKGSSTLRFTNKQLKKFA